MPLPRKSNELILSDVPTERLRCVPRLAKRRTSGNQANGLGQASSIVSCRMRLAVMCWEFDHKTGFGDGSKVGVLDDKDAGYRMLRGGRTGKLWES